MLILKTEVLFENGSEEKLVMAVQHIERDWNILSEKNEVENA